MEKKQTKFDDNDYCQKKYYKNHKMISSPFCETKIRYRLWNSDEFSINLSCLYIKNIM